MPTPTDILGHLPGGRVLDLATGSGSFIHFLLEGLPGYTEIIGLDNNDRATSAFVDAFKDHPNIHFEHGDAQHLAFEPASFDLVCISNSLHHFNDPSLVLLEMIRVLRPGGSLIISEMIRDGQTETQMTHVHLHHWWAAVDSVNGMVHRETYRRQELVAIMTGLALENPIFYDLADLEENPKNPEIQAELEPVFDRYHQRAEGYPELQARGAELRQRVREIGFHSATTLLAIGRKDHIHE